MTEPQNQQYSSDLHAAHGVLPPLATQMKVDVMLNKQGIMTILHDKPIVGEIEWLEYDRETGQFMFLFKDGHVQDLGLEFPDHVRNGSLLQSGQVFLLYVNNGKKQDLDMLPLMVRGDSHEERAVRK